ncbi:hypothetical protein [Bdellovibrio sp. HCB337]|uniref:hypothetical protein n=1 Tax=Bdellovibrio sp. HCB337 TaxID=3394358 RepID=UPI0039A4D4EB
MSWFKTLTSYIVAAQMLLVPMLAHAQKAEVITVHSGTATPQGINFEAPRNVLTAEGAKKVESLSKYANNLGYDSRVDLQGKKVLLIDRNTKKVAMEIPLQDERTLKEFSPKSLNQKLSAEWNKVKVANKAAYSQVFSAQGLPLQSGLFFMALGGLVLMELQTKYADNPVAMQQHIDHTLSPVGTLGFGLFMYGQGLTSNVLSLWTKNPKLQMPIGMLGMTVGFAMQSYFSQVVMDPNIRACAASVFKGEKIEGNNHPCEGAYKYLVLEKKIFTGPAMIGLLGSFVAGMAVKVAIGKTLRMVGFNIAMWLAPGGVPMKIVRAGIQVADMAVFTVIQLKLEHMVTYPWKNYWDGKDFIDINDRIVADIEAHKKSQWKDKPTEMIARLKEFNKKMADWRMNNISDAYMAHQAWSELLLQLTTVYNNSYNFYSSYTNHLNSEGSSIDRAYPLNGVTPADLVQGHEDLYVMAPARIEALQKVTVAETAKKIAENIQSGHYKSLEFNQEQLSAVTKIQEGLAAEDINTNGLAIYNLNVLISKNTRNLNLVGSPRFGAELLQIYYSLGKPEPMFEKGRGYAASLMLSPNSVSSFGAEPISKVNGRFSTPTSADYFVVQMICGPETASKEKVIALTKGFPAKFIPPALALDNGDKDSLCLGASTTPWENWRIYQLPLSQQKTAPDYIRANIDPEAGKDFPAWWEKGTASQMRQAFKFFSGSYKEIVKKLMVSLSRKERSSWNRGFVSNGSLMAAKQEVGLYSLILGELLKDAYRAQTKQELPKEYLASNDDPAITVIAKDYELSKKPLLALLGQGRHDFNTLLSAQPNNKATRSLEVQRSIEAAVSSLETVILAGGKDASKITTDSVQKNLATLDASVKAFGALLGTISDGETAPLVNLTDEQKALAVTCLELLQQAANELSMYGNMVLTAQYPEPKEN